MTTEFRLLDFNIINEIDDNDSDSDDEKYKTNQDKRKFVIQMFGIDETGRTYSVFVEKFQPFLYIKVSEDWNINTKEQFIMYIKKGLTAYYENSLVECILIRRHKLYGFDNKKLYKFLRLKFTNSIAMNKVKNLFYYTRIKYNVTSPSGNT